MPRTAPVMPTEAPGNFNTGALFNATMKAVGDWQINVPRFKGYAATTQSIGSGTTFAALSLDSEQIDTEGGHSTVTNTSRYTIQVAGSYWAYGTCSLPSGGGAGNRELQLAVNGTTAMGATIVQSAAGANSWGGVVGGFLQLAVNDYIELMVWQNSGGALNTNISTNVNPTLCAIWMSS